MRAKGVCDITLVIDGEVVELKETGVKAEPGQPGFGAEADEANAEPPTVIFAGKQKRGGKLIILAVAFERDDFKNAQEQVLVQGLMIQNLNFSMDGKNGMRFMSGTARLEQAAEENGAPVIGSVDVTIHRMVQVEVD